MTITVDDPMNNDAPKSTVDRGSIEVKNCEANTWVSSEFKCPIINKIIRVESGICKERCEFAS
jgi:hypothetical protein